MQTPQQQQQQFQQQLQQRASAMQATGRMPNGRHGSFEMGQPSQGWAHGSGPLPGMNQGRPPMSGYPNVLLSSLLQQQQHQHSTHQQEILDMSDFPALGSVNSSSSNPGLSASYASTAGTLTTSSAAGNGLSQEFSIEDDFPALPGARSNTANSSRHFGSMQLHQQQPSHQTSSRSQQTLQHHPTQQQGQHLLQQSQLDGMGTFSSMINPSGSQLQQSMQLQQQLASDMMFQQQQLLHMNGAHSSINAHIPGSSNDLGKAIKSYATKAGNGSGLFLASSSNTMSASSSAGAPLTPMSGGNATYQGLLQTGSGALSSTRQGDSSLGSATTGNSSAELKASGLALDDHDRFGLFGMLGVIRAADQDSTMLTLGRDLTSLGLSLNSAEPLYGTFASPWFDSQSSVDTEAEFHVPACYNVQPPPPPQAKLSSVLDETLFYIFYSMPRDALQDAAAVELYNRHWRYHKELRLWLMKDQSSEQSKTPTFERGTYIFFDPSTWEKVKKDFIVMYDALEERRQVGSILPNGNTTTSTHSLGSSLANGAGPISNASTHVNGMDSSLHADLLNSLNTTPGSANPQQIHMKQTGAASNVMGSSIHGPHVQAFQQRQQQQPHAASIGSRRESEV